MAAIGRSCQPHEPIFRSSRVWANAVRSPNAARRSDWSVLRTLKQLGVSPSSYYRWLKEEKWELPKEPIPPVQAYEALSKACWDHGISMKGWHDILWMPTVHPHAPVVEIVRIKDGDDIRFLEHPHLEVPENIGHRLNEALIVRVRKNEARSQYIPEFPYDFRVFTGHQSRM